MRHFILFFLINLLFSVSSFSQTCEESVVTLNSILDKYHGGNIKMTLEKKYLSVQFYKEGKMYREDKLYAYLLDDESVEFNRQEKVVQVKCKADKKGKKECVDRNIMDKGIRRPYNRMTFEVGSNKKDVDDFIEELKYFILKFNDSEYTRK